MEATRKRWNQRGASELRESRKSKQNCHAILPYPPDPSDAPKNSFYKKPSINRHGRQTGYHLLADRLPTGNAMTHV